MGNARRRIYCHKKCAKAAAISAAASFYRAIIKILPKMSRLFVDKDLYKCYNKLRNATFFTYNIANYLFLAHFMYCILVGADR